RAAIERGQGGYANGRLGGDEIRIYAAPLADIGGAAAGGAVVVASSTHDLQATLASLHLFVVLAGLAGALLAAAAVALLMRGALQQDAKRLAELADDLLVLSREEASPRPPDVVRLDELVRALAHSDPAVEAVAPDPVPVRGDRPALERALANLVENAHLHGPD